MRVPRREQFSGCLIGQCAGDALGWPVEGASPARCRRYLDQLAQVRPLGIFHRGRHPLGQYTDDSQLARELLQSYVTCGRFDPGDYAARIASIFAERRIMGPGRATAEAVRRLARGIPWNGAGTPPPAAGNGSAMRAAPVGLIYYNDPEQLIEAAHDQGRITHADPRCSAGAVAIAGAVSMALQWVTIEPGAFVEQISRWVAAVDGSVAAALRHLEEWVTLPPESALPLIATAGLDHRLTAEREGISGFVTSSVLWSLYSFLRGSGDYWQTISTAILGGGDVDTTAAMAGAISGAHLGLETVPSELAERLTDQGTWGYDELVALAHACYDLKMSGAGAPPRAG